MKKLYKIKKKGKITGVCAGLSELTKIDVTIIRVLVFLLCWFYGTGLLIYILLALLLPDKESLYR